MSNNKKLGYYPEGYYDDLKEFAYSIEFLSHYHDMVDKVINSGEDECIIECRLENLSQQRYDYEIIKSILGKELNLNFNDIRKEVIHNNFRNIIIKKLMINKSPF